jgi:two-component system, cell cycle sensor histidine kinase and response regulator CckA
MQSEPRLDFGALFENDLDACALVDQEQVILRVNRAFERLFGYAAHDAIGRCIDDLIVPADRRAEGEAFEQRARALGELSLHTVRRRRDGSLVPVWIVAQPHPLDDRTLVYVQYRDLSEQKRIADSLRAGEAKLRAVFENAPVGIVLANAELNVVECNAVFSAMIGYSELELRGLRAEVWNHPDEMAETRRLRAALETGEMDRAMQEKRYVRRDGTVFWARLTVSAIRNVEGAVESYIGVVEDITVARQARLRREAALSLFKSLIETMRDGIVVESHDRRLTAVNPAWMAIFGQAVHPEQVVGMDMKEATRHAATLAEEPERFLETIERRIAEGVPARDTVEFSDGRMFERDYSPIRGGGSGSGHLWVYHDLTDLMTLQAQLRQSQKMEAVGRLAGGIAHDFNNLLTVLQGHAALLLEEPLSSGARSDVQEIVSAANKAANVTRQLLAYSRQQVLKPVVLDLNEVVHELGRTLLRMIREDIRLEVDLNAGIPPIRADRTQIEQVVLNLAVNARDAMPRGGALRMETTPLCLQHSLRIRELTLPAGSYAVLRVTDTGVGIEESVLPRIFDPFFTTKELGKGTGLGLSTVYGIVKQSGAFITVDSQKAGGTTFTIYFPQAETPASGPPSINS